MRDCRLVEEMKLFARRRMVAALGFALASMPAMGADLLSFINLDSMPTTWQIGAGSGGSVSISREASSNLNSSSGSLRATYPSASGAVYAWGAYDVASLKTNDLYIEFWAKMPAAKHGLKFLKIFGSAGSGGGVANTTFGLDYTGVDPGALYQISFGDGTTNNNDTQNVINLDGTYPQWIGRSYGKAVVQTPMKQRFASSKWGTSWHHFKMRVKFNSGTTAANEVADGAYYLEIDGNVYVDAKNVFNRHYSNGPIERVEILGWSQGGGSAFEIWYDDVRITRNGFSNDVSPMPPSAIAVE